MRTFGPSPSVRQPEFPMYLMGRRGLGASAAQEGVALTAAAAPVAISEGASLAVSSGLMTAAGAASAVPVVGAAVAVVLAIVSALLGAHEQRAADAKNENAAADSATETFDQIIKQLESSFNSGQITAAQAASMLQQTQQTMLTTLQSKVGPPGTAWTKNPPAPGVGTPCNSDCTVGCCVYYNDLVPPLIMFGQAANAIGGSLSAAQSVAASQPAFYGATKAGPGTPSSASGENGICTSFTFGVPAIASSKYSDYTRASYQITLTQPTMAGSVLGPASSLVGGSSIAGGSGLLPLLGIGLLAYLIL